MSSGTLVREGLMILTSGVLERASKVAFKDGKHFAVSTDGNTFTLDHLPAGTYDLEVTRPGYVAQHLAGVTVTAGGATALGTLALAEGGSVHVEVAIGGGRAAPG